MGREETASRKRVRDFCFMYQMDAQTLLDRATLLLSSYRNICYTSCLDNEECTDSVFEEKKPIDIVLFLEELDPHMDQTVFIRTVRERTDKNWIIEMVESALAKVNKMPNDGELYFEILNKRYVIQIPYNEPEMLEMLNISRARYYDKRWEAMVIFGLCFWGSVIPQTKKMLTAS